MKENEQIELENINCLCREHFKSDRDFTEWIEVAHMAGFETVTEMIWILYVECDWGLRKLDKEIGFDQRTFSRKLTAMGVIPKPQGGPNRVKYQEAA